MTIVPEETPLTRPYWEAARQGRIVVQECTVCRRRWHPPQPSCPDCRAESYTWEDAPTVGTIHSHTVVRRAAHSAVNESLPYVVALIALEPNVIIICNIVDSDLGALSVGSPVDIRLGRTPAGVDLPLAVLRG